MYILNNNISEITIQVFYISKIYPKFVKIYKYDTPTTKQIEGFEQKTQKTSKKTSLQTDPENVDRSLRRSKTILSDLVLCNEFDLFVTFTFAKDRQNLVKLKTQMSNWLTNQKKIHGKFTYLIVPEFHKDKKSLHFHALFKNYKGQLVDSGKKVNNRKVYNIKSYQLGFSTAIKIDDLDKVSNYLKKYITKDMPRIERKKRFWSSKNLQKPTIILNSSFDDYPSLEFNKSFSVQNMSIYLSEKVDTKDFTKPKEFGIITT